MKPHGHVYMTTGLAQTYDNSTDKEKDVIEMMIKYYIEQFNFLIRVDQVHAVYAIYNLIDQESIQSSRISSCKKGCSFCCRQNIDIFEEEVKIIADYCKKLNIPIDRQYLLKQLLIEKDEQAFSVVGNCVFLKNGECSIYEVRPMVCRKFYVVSPPSHCDTMKHRHSVSIINDMHVEAIFSAFMNVSKNSDLIRMSQALLPYSK